MRAGNFAQKTSLIAFLFMCSACDGAVKSAVKRDLIDPHSALFSEIKTEGGITCGLVNSKNRMGGYVGDRIFLYQGGDVYFSNSDGFSDISKSSCSAEAFSTYLSQPSY